jgi:hypothetical protein
MSQLGKIVLGECFEVEGKLYLDLTTCSYFDRFCFSAYCDKVGIVVI